MGRGIGDKAARRSQGARKAAANRSKRQCPRCLRKNALSAPARYDDRWVARYCYYCGHGVGRIDGKLFGRDVTPEPGVRK